MAFRPMLASPSVKPADIPASAFPLLASYKYDGIRCVITADGPLSRSLKPIPNKHVAAALDELPMGLDGELLAVDADGRPLPFGDQQHVFMGSSDPGHWQYLVFDTWESPEATFGQRYARLCQYVVGLPRFVQLVHQQVCQDKDDVEEMFRDALAAGFEGLILRRAQDPYKFGRATAKSWSMAKCKPIETAEAVVVGMTEAMENTNAAYKDATGRTKRSSAKAGKVGKGVMGTLIVVSDKWPGKRFEIGTGFTDAQRVALWRDGAELHGEGIVTFEYLDVGGYDVPRSASFKGFRSKEDMS